MLKSIVIMILRVYALFFRNRTIVSILLIMWLAQIAISAAGLHSGFGEPPIGFCTGLQRLIYYRQAAPLPPGFVGNALESSDMSHLSHAL